MAAIINEIIPVQNSELVLNKIGLILFEELSNQKVLDPTIEDFDTYIERICPYDNSEDVMVNVSLNNINYSGQNLKDGQGLNSFHIDIYVNGEETETTSGDTVVRVMLHKFVGMVRYILTSGKYPWLGFAPGFIGGKYIESIQFSENIGNKDSDFIRMARITYNVRIQENQQMANPIDFFGNDSGFKLELTEKGQKIIFNN